MVVTTREQRETLLKIWQHRNGVTAPGKVGESYLAFRRRLLPGMGWVAVVMPEGLYIGIEPGGYAHT